MIGDWCEKLEVIVADLREQAIIGLNFLSKQGMILDMQHMELGKGNHVLSCYDEKGRPFCVRLIVAES